MEQFMPCLGFEAFYEVSNLGTVRSLERIDAAGVRRKRRILKPTRTLDGYLRVNFWAEGVARRFLLHRVVFEAFHGPIPRGHEVNHLNGKRDDCRPENLNALTHTDNVRYSRDVLGANYVTRGNARLTESQVKEIRALKAEGRSGSEIAAVYGVTKSLVNQIGRRVAWAHL